MAEEKEIEVYFQSRLKEEQEILEKYFWPKKFPILYINTEPCFEHTVQCKWDRTYKLRVYMGRDYPDILPDLVVCQPKPELMPNGPEWSGSHKTHTWPRKYGFLHICHWHWACWTRENMIYQVFSKGEEWLEAYEKYRENGKIPLDLEQMQLTEEEKMKEKNYALTFVQDLAIRWHFHAMIREILCQRFLITDNERRIRQQVTLGSFIQVAHQNPIITGRLEEMFEMHGAISELQHLPTTNDEIGNAPKRIPEFTMKTSNHEPTIICITAQCRLKYETIQCQQANSGCSVKVSFTLKREDRSTLQ